MADQDLVYLIRRYTRPLQRGARGNCAELSWMHIAKSSAVAAYRCSRGTDNDYVGRGHILLMISLRAP